jgi:hypothetical protein
MFLQFRGSIRWFGLSPQLVHLTRGVQLHLLDLLDLLGIDLS